MTRYVTTFYAINNGQGCGDYECRICYRLVEDEAEMKRRLLGETDAETFARLLGAPVVPLEIAENATREAARHEYDYDEPPEPEYEYEYDEDEDRY